MTGIDIEEFDGEAGLDAREFTLLSRLYQICIWMAKNKRKEVIKLVIDEYDTDEASAETWVRKAEDFMALGVLEGAASARQAYNHRLQKIHDLCMAHAVKDEVEVTTKPYRVMVIDRDGQQTGETKIITAQQTKVRVNVLDTSAINVALKAAREMAMINGGRAVDSRGNTTYNNVNVQVNNTELPGANRTSDLSNEELAKLAGFLPVPDIVIEAEPGSKDVVDVQVVPSGTPGGQEHAPRSQESTPIHPADDVE